VYPGEEKPKGGYTTKEKVTQNSHRMEVESDHVYPKINGSCRVFYILPNNYDNLITC
jgi:hypothetical protein